MGTLSGMTLDPAIFKAYDVRGIVPDQFDPDGAYRVARAYVEVFQAKHIAIGHDMRLSSPTLAEAAIRGDSQFPQDTARARLHTFGDVCRAVRRRRRRRASRRRSGRRCAELFRHSDEEWRGVSWCDVDTRNLHTSDNGIDHSAQGWWRCH